VATLKSSNGPGSRVDAGNHVLDAAESLGQASMKLVGARFATFVKVHSAYVKAEEAVKGADSKVRAQQGKVGTADVAQDEVVDELASALAGEGMPRMSPFKPFGFASPTDIKKMGDTAEATEVTRLAAAVLKRKPPLPKSRAAATKLARAAKAVHAAAAPLETLLKNRRTAISKRDALELGWETAFASLKRGARAAEDDGALGLYDSLFGSGPTPKKAK